MEKYKPIVNDPEKTDFKILEIANKGVKNFGAAIRIRRESLGLKVYELAKKVGVNPVYITQIEKHGKLPSPSIMKKITDLLADPDLFRIYLKMKYPLVYEEIRKEDDDLGSEFNKIKKEFSNKEYTAEAEKKYQKRLSIYEARVRKLEENLGKIKKLHLKLKNTPEDTDKSKD